MARRSWPVRAARALLAGRHPPPSRTRITVLLESDIHAELLGPARAFASSYGLAETDLAWDEQVALHIGEALEKIYEKAKPPHRSIPLAVSPTVVEISLSTTVLGPLHDCAVACARRQTSKDPKLLEEFEWRFIGCRLEQAYLWEQDRPAREARRSLEDQDDPGQLGA